MTLTEAKAAIKALGMTLRRENGEYRVAFRGKDSEASAYYTTDLADAVATARMMAT